MKRIILAVAMVALTGQAWGADCNQLATKFINAAQKEDLKTLLNMSAIYQGNAANIRKNAPKYDQERLLSELYEREKKHLKIWMFTPKAKWQIVETKAQKAPTATGKSTNTCLAYVQTKYEDFEDAPNSDYLPVFEPKKLTSVVTPLWFDLKTGYLYNDNIEVDINSVKYWPTETKQQVPQ